MAQDGVCSAAFWLLRELDDRTGPTGRLMIREQVYGFNESRILRMVIGNYLNPARERYIWHRSSSVLDDFRTTTSIQQHHFLASLHYYCFQSSPLSTSIILLYPFSLLLHSRCIPSSTSSTLPTAFPSRSRMPMPMAWMGLSLPQRSRLTASLPRAA
jgi:hypothetical protein